MVPGASPSMVRKIWLSIFFCAIVALGAQAIDDEDEDAPDTRALRALSGGTLFICGGGDISDDVMLQFIDSAGGEDARIVVVTTASETADTDEVEEELEFWRSQPIASLTVLHTRSREIANDPKFYGPLSEATGIWFIGGKQAWLADTYVGTATEQELHGVLRRGGVVGGISAGAAVMSSVMIRSGDPEPEMGRGFGFLPGTVIDQHFLARNRQERLLGALALHPGLVGLGIDEGAAIVIRGSRLSVVGDSQVVACISSQTGRPPRVETLKPGEETNLVSLSKAANRPKNRRAAAVRPVSADTGAD